MNSLVQYCIVRSHASLCVCMEQTALLLEREAFAEARERLEIELAAKLAAQERAAERTAGTMQRSLEDADAEISSLTADLDQLAASHREQVTSLVQR